MGRLVTALRAVLGSRDLRSLATFVMTLALAGAAFVWAAYVVGTGVRVFCLASKLCGGGL